MTIRGTVAASGYNATLEQVYGHQIIDVGTLVEKNIPTEILPHITNGQVLEGVLEFGGQIRFFKPVTVGPWRPLEKNQRFVLDQPHASSICMQVCGRFHKAIKIDDDTRRALRDHHTEVESQMLDAVWQGWRELAHTQALTGMMAHVSHRNQGVKAGLHGNINLGSYTAPRHLTPDNIVTFFTNARAVLVEAGRWQDGGMFMVVPRQMSDLLLHTAYGKQFCCSFGDNVIIRGMKAEDILGFSVFESPRLRSYIDVNTKRVVHPILFGWRDAYAFNGIIDGSGIRDIEQSNGYYYYWLSTIAHGVIYPDALALAHVTFETEGLTA